MSSLACSWFSKPGGGNWKPDSWAVVGGPLPLDGKPKSDPVLVKCAGEADEPERLRETPIPSRADAREDDPAEYDGVTPVRAGDEACEAFVDAEAALGEERSG